MNRLRLGIIFLALTFAYPALAQRKQQDRVENSGRVMKEILTAASTIPQTVLDNADCIVILPSVIKTSFGLGGSFGRGVMTCREGESFRGPWGAPSMMTLFGISAGPQFGVEATDFVLLLMSPRSASSLLTSKVKLGGDATAAAGPFGRTASAETDINMRAEILSYSRARGLFAGVSLAGSTLRADNGGNTKLYGKEVSAKDIVLSQAVPVPTCAEELLAILQKATPSNKKLARNLRESPEPGSGRLSELGMDKISGKIAAHPKPTTGE
jgi:SH3 domain-containing YSC84-like protein 1